MKDFLDWLTNKVRFFNLFKNNAVNGRFAEGDFDEGARGEILVGKIG